MLLPIAVKSLLKGSVKVRGCDQAEFDHPDGLAIRTARHGFSKGAKKYPDISVYRFQAIFLRSSLTEPVVRLQSGQLKELRAIWKSAPDHDLKPSTIQTVSSYFF